MASLLTREFVIALADHLASAPLGLSRSGTAIAMFALEADEQNAAAVYSVLRPYGGRIDQTPVPAVSVQCMTVAKSPAESLARAQSIADRLRDSAGRTKRNLAITGFVVKAVTAMTAPGLIGVDDKGRAQCVFNFDASYLAA